jgi:hypothetical protein
VGKTSIPFSSFNYPLNGTQMALTDNTTTLEEFTAAHGANPALKDVAIEFVKTLGLTPYSQTELDTVLGSKIGEKTGAIHSAYDKDIFEVTGLQKPGEKKTYEFLKEVLGNNKTEIASLKQQLAQGAGDATLKAQYEALQQQETQLKQDLETARTENFQKDVKLDVRDGLRELKFDATVKESVRNVLVNNATDRIIAMAKVQKNADDTTQIVYVENGKTKLNDQNQPADAAYILSEMLKDVLDTGHQGQGAGAGRDDKRPPLDDKGNVKVPDARPANVTTKTDVMQWLIGLGVKQGTPEFDAAYGKHSQGLKLA